MWSTYWCVCVIILVLYELRLQGFQVFWSIQIPHSKKGRAHSCSFLEWGNTLNSSSIGFALQPHLLKSNNNSSWCIYLKVLLQIWGWGSLYSLSIAISNQATRPCWPPELNWNTPFLWHSACGTLLKASTGEVKWILLYTLKHLVPRQAALSTTSMWDTFVCLWAYWQPLLVTVSVHFSEAVNYLC